MTRHIFFAAFLTISCLIAAVRGGAPERIASSTLFASAILSVGVVRPIGLRFADLEVGVFLVDVLALGILVWVSIRSTRFWPLWLSAMLGAEAAVHLIRSILPAIVPEAYRDAQAVWSWIAQLILLLGTMRHHARLRHEGSEPDWKRSSLRGDRSARQPSHNSASG